MKYLLPFAALLLSGCATVANFSGHETCALQNLKLAGTTMGTSTGVEFINSDHFSATGVSVTNSESVSCVVPESKFDECQIAKFHKAAIPKVDYNDSIGLKKTVTGIGYVLWVVPGLIAKLVFDHSLAKTNEESQKVYADPANQCVREEQIQTSVTPVSSPAEISPQAATI